MIEASQATGGRGESETNPWRKTGEGDVGGGGGLAPAEPSGDSLATERVTRGVWEGNFTQKESRGAERPHGRIQRTQKLAPSQRVNLSPGGPEGRKPRRRAEAPPQSE